MATGQEISALRGRMGFSNSQYFGRIGANTFHVMNKVDACSGPRWVPPELEEAVDWWLDAVKDMPPMRITFGDDRPPIRIFSDGACEGDGVKKTTYGAVMIDSLDGPVEAFGATMGRAMSELLGEDGKKKQLIGQAQILPMLASRMVWSGRIEGRDVLHYVDNDAVGDATIKGSSPSRGSAWMAHAFWEIEATNRSHSWVSRVPTLCNIDDGPSRDEWKELEALYPKFTRREWTVEQEEVLMRRWGR